MRKSKRAAREQRANVISILDAFDGVRREEEAKHGTYRTKDTILEPFDAMEESATTGGSYQMRLGPPPADQRAAHLPMRGAPVEPASPRTEPSAVGLRRVFVAGLVYPAFGRDRIVCLRRF